MNPFKKIKYEDLSCVFHKCCVFHSDHFYIYLTNIYWVPSICQALDLLGNGDSAKKTGKKSSSQVACILVGSPDWSSEPGMQRNLLPKDLAVMAVLRWFRTNGVLCLKDFVLDGSWISWAGHSGQNLIDETESFRHLQCGGDFRCYGNHLS